MSAKIKCLLRSASFQEQFKVQQKVEQLDKCIVVMGQISGANEVYSPKDASLKSFTQGFEVLPVGYIYEKVAKSSSPM